jgi:hypothetical protein
MRNKATITIITPLIIIALIAITIFALSRPTNEVDINSLFRSRSAVQTPFNSAAAADLSAYRWQAMANFYKDNDLLNSGTFDSVAAADLSAYRWQAMANFYKDNDLLNSGTFDSAAAADLSAYRWQAMANFYKDNDLLNSGTFDSAAAADLSAYRWQAMANFYEVPQAMETAVNPELQAFHRDRATRATAGDLEAVNAVDPIDLKLFNTIYRPAAAVTAAGSSMDPVDLKLFNTI